MRLRAGQGRPSGRLFAVCLLSLLAATSPALAGDRPFLIASTIAGEADDDNVWSVDAAVQSVRGGEGAWLLQAEYAFDPQTSLQIASTRASRIWGAELEFKRAFNSFAHDGWAVGVSLSVAANKAPAEAWRNGGWQAALPFSWQASESLQLHATLGLSKEPELARERLTAVAAQWALDRRWTLFAEGGKTGDTQLAHAGVRWWVKREKFALDLSAYRSRTDGSTERGWVFGLSLQDL